MLSHSQLSLPTRENRVLKLKDREDRCKYTPWEDCGATEMCCECSRSCWVALLSVDIVTENSDGDWCSVGVGVDEMSFSLE